MKVILTTPIKNLGTVGSVVNVKDGYARNFLIPKQLAKKFSKLEMEILNQKKHELEKISEQRAAEAQKIVDQLSELSITVRKRASMEGNLYGSVSNRDIIQALQENGINVTSDQVKIYSRIKSVGEHEVELDLYADVSTKIALHVKASNM